jgi:hypothetical protein
VNLYVKIHLRCHIIFIRHIILSVRQAIFNS